MNNWKKIWESRQDNLGKIDADDYRTVFAELARIDGYDIQGAVPINSLLKQYESIKSAIIDSGGGIASLR